MTIIRSIRGENLSVCLVSEGKHGPALRIMMGGKTSVVSLEEICSMAQIYMEASTRQQGLVNVRNHISETAKELARQFIRIVPA